MFIFCRVGCPYRVPGRMDSPRDRVNIFLPRVKGKLPILPSDNLWAVQLCLVVRLVSVYSIPLLFLPGRETTGDNLYYFLRPSRYGLESELFTLQQSFAIESLSSIQRASALTVGHHTDWRLESFSGTSSLMVYWM